MSARTLRSLPWLAFGGAVGAVLVSFSVLARSATFAAHPDLYSLAMTADLLLTVPLAYLVLARKRGASLRPLLPLFVLMVLLGTWILPAGNRELLDGIRTVALPAVELLVLGYLVFAVRRARTRYRSVDSFDAMKRMRSAALEIAGNGTVAAVAASELALLYYALLPFRAPREVPESGRAFSSHRNSGIVAILVTLMAVASVETVGVHLLVAMWRPPVAWALTALGVYSLLFLLAHVRALSMRPHVVTDSHLFVRNGLLHAADVPLEEIVDVRSPRPEDGPELRALNTASPVTPNVAVLLRRERETTGLYGIRKRVRCLLLHVDERSGFLERLEPAIAQPGPTPGER